MAPLGRGAGARGRHAGLLSLLVAAACASIASASDPMLKVMKSMVSHKYSIPKKPRKQNPGTLANALRGRRLDDAPVDRKTWNDCDCKKEWNFEGVGSCNQTCCAPDNDPLGKWCMVKDPTCEESEWGYCRPAGTTAGACTDSPIYWEDVEGDSCGSYAVNQFCAPDGTYGSGWDNEWGTFEDYAVGGVTALQACCNCGGGSTQAQRCQDTEGWADEDGDTCDIYRESAWCNLNGQPGVGWHTADWGDIQDFKHDGNTAFDACCACGGGSNSTTPLAAGILQRYTWTGCACKKSWGEGCQTYCCTEEEDPVPWCEVQDPLCEEAEWGYCRPDDWSPIRDDTCSNFPAGWRDSQGYSCIDYSDLQYCKADGSPGPLWSSGWGSIKDYKAEAGAAVGAGLSALDVCCACGGGHAAGQAVSHYEGCTDKEGWSDRDGDGCLEYADYFWCNADGKPGVGWHMEWGTLEAMANGGYTGIQACCVCGGGSRDGAVIPTAAPTPAPPPGYIAPTPAPPPGGIQAPTASTRFTWNGCICMTDWAMEDNPAQKCTSSCCNPDQDSFGDWCMVADLECEDSDWGYCRPAQAMEEFETCRNSPEGWSDSEGDTCVEYGTSGWCKRDRTVGRTWEEDWGKIEDYAVDGKSAFDVCCECGGGLSKDGMAGCTDLASWADADGDTCNSYQDYAWCTSSGGTGVGWHEEWGDFTGTPTADKACCFCGGGNRGTALISGNEQLDNDGVTGKSSSGGAAATVMVLIAVITGLGLGWYCYRNRAGKEVDAEGLGAGVGKNAIGRRYGRVTEPEI